jgi:hypothetical protein
MQRPKRRTGAKVNWTPTPSPTPYELQFGEERLPLEEEDQAVTPRTDSLVYEYGPMSDEEALESYREKDFVDPFAPVVEEGANEDEQKYLEYARRASTLKLRDLLLKKNEEWGKKAAEERIAKAREEEDIVNRMKQETDKNGPGGSDL